MEICCQMQHSADAAMEMQPILSDFNLRGRKRRRNIYHVKPHWFNYNQFDIPIILVILQYIIINLPKFIFG